MDFELTEEQHALADLARDVLAKLYPSERLRELWAGAERDPNAWTAMASVGFVGLGIPEEFGGMGGDAIDVHVVLDAAGAAAVPEPLLETAAVAGPVLAEAGSDAQRDRWLPAIAAGEAIATVLTDGHPYAVDADIADLLLLVRGSDVRLFERGAFVAARVPAEDRTRRLFAVSADPADGQQLPGDSNLLTARGAAGTAALLNGVSGALLARTVDHAKTRHQFGRPIGSFQAVKHKLASVWATLESSRAATRYAAYAVAHRLPDAATAASVAKVHAVDAEALANAEALQCHGGIGFTWEHELHWWLKRGLALEHVFGSAAEHRAMVATALFDEETRDGDA